MVIFNSYVKLPEGSWNYKPTWLSRGPPPCTGGLSESLLLAELAGLCDLRLWFATTMSSRGYGRHSKAHQVTWRKVG